MKIIHGLNNVENFHLPSSITIGMFDSLHLGHQKILKELKKKGNKTCVITFSNHPVNILYPGRKIELIYSIEEKIKHFEKFEIDTLVVLEFNKEIANLSYRDFLNLLKKKFFFSSLILGKDSFLGNNKLGNPNNIKSLEKILDFKVEYIEKVKYKNRVISSTFIRELISNEDYTTIELLLNRPFKKREKRCQQTYLVES